MPDKEIVWLPDLLYVAGRFESDLALVCDAAGLIARIARADELNDEMRVRLSRRALLPGMINAHSHAFQRVLRGRTEYRTGSTSFSGGLMAAESGGRPTLNEVKERDSFWTWREMMYSAATRLTPDDVYDASRMAFLEMALSGITAVGEFHYLHNAPEGTSYDDSNLLAKEVMRAAGEVGLLIALLRVAYARSGFQTETNPKQARFIESDSEVYLKNVESLVSVRSPTVREGSLRWVDGWALPNSRAIAPAKIVDQAFDVCQISLRIPFNESRLLRIRLSLKARSRIGNSQ